MTLTQDLGDDKIYSIPLRWGGSPFVPGSGWNLIFTVKADVDDTDVLAKIQKQTGTGITHSGSNALVVIVPANTTGGTFTPVGAGSPVTVPALTAGTYYWDIQAQNITTNEVKTVARGKLALGRDITRGTVTSVPMYVSPAPAPVQGASAYQVAVANGFVGNEAAWLESLVGPAGPSETTSSILTKLEGAALLAGKIGEEYLPPEWYGALSGAIPPSGGLTAVSPNSTWWNHVVECAYNVALPLDAGDYEGKKFMLRTEAAIMIFNAYANGTPLAVIPAPTNYGITHTLIESIGGIWMATLNYSGVPAGGASTAAAVSYSNTVSGLTADDVQLAIDEVVVSLNAIASAKQPIDSDLTAYANAADAAARRVLIGASSIADITAASFTGTLPVSKGGTGTTAASVGTGGVLLGNQAVSTTNSVTFSTVNGGALSGNNSGDNAVNSLYSGLVTNQTHTGDATGSVALIVRGINGVLMSGLATGITKNTTGTGSPSIAVAGDFPTLNQSTTGNAATVTGLSVTATKTLTCSNTLTLAGTDGSTLTIGTGGTLGTAAYTASSSYATAAQGTDARVPTAAGLTTQFATAAATVIDADRMAIFDSTASFAPKHALLSTLWTWIKAKIDAGQTWAGIQVFSSNTRPTSSGTGTPTATSLVTRNDVLPEFLQYIPTALALSTTTGTADTNGSNVGNSAVISLLNTSVAGNYREVVCSSIPIHRTGSGANIRFSDSIFTLLFDLQSNGFWNNYYKFLFGVSSIQSLTAAGIGIEWTSVTSGVIQIHDGTSLYTQAFTLTGFDSSKLHKFALVWNRGSLTLFWKGWNDYLEEGRFAQIATLTRGGLPTVMSGTTCKFVNVATGPPGAAMSLNIREAKFLSTNAMLA